MKIRNHRFFAPSGKESASNFLEDMSDLHSASSFGAVEEVCKLLTAGTDVDIKNKDNETPLHTAASMGNSVVAQVLINAGADVHAKGMHGLTPLHAAASMGNSVVAQVLINAGADIHSSALDGTGGIILRARAMALGCTGIGGITPLHSAAGLGFDTPGLVKALGHTRAQRFIKELIKRLAEVAQVLIDAGAEVDIKAANGGTPLYTAAFKGQPHVARVLINAGADVNAKDIGGYTPLHASTFEVNEIPAEHMEVAQVLIDAGADVNARARFGSTPIQLAKTRKNTEMVDFLIKHGADC